MSYGPIVVPNADDPMGSIQPCGTEEPGVFTEVAAFQDFLSG